MRRAGNYERVHEIPNSSLLLLLSFLRFSRQTVGIYVNFSQNEFHFHWLFCAISFCLLLSGAIYLPCTFNTSSARRDDEAKVDVGNNGCSHTSGIKPRRVSKQYCSKVAPINGANYLITLVFFYWVHQRHQHVWNKLFIVIGIFFHMYWKNSSFSF